VTTQRLWCSLALLLLTPAIALRAADKGEGDTPLPPGARARLGTGLCFIGVRGGAGSHLLAPDYRTFLAGDWSHGPRIHDLRTGKVTDVPGFAPVARPGRPPTQEGSRIVAVSADGKRAVAVRVRTGTVVFEVATGKELGAVPRGTDAQNTALSADGTVLAFEAVGKDRTRDVVVWNVDKGAEVARAKGLRNDIFFQMVLSPEGKTLLTVARSREESTAAQLWDATSGRLIAALPDDHVGGPAAFSPDGKTLATADKSSGAVHLWDAATGKSVALLLGRSDPLVKLAFAPDGKTLAALATNWAVERWALADGKLLKPTPFPAADVLGYSTAPGGIGLVFADNARIVAWGELGGVALVWEAPGGKLLTPITGHVGAVSTLRFTAGGKEVLTAGPDRYLYRWDAGTGRRTAVVETPPLEQLQYYSTGLLLYLSPDGTRALRERALAEVGGEEVFALSLGNPVPSADFRRIAGIAWRRAGNNTVITHEVWDSVARKRLAQLELPDTLVPSPDSVLAFSPDGSRIVAALSVRDATAPGEQPLLVTGWDVASGKRLGEFRDPTRGRGFGGGDRPHLAPAGNNSGVVLATPDGKLWVVDYERGVQGETLAELNPTPGRFTHPTFAPDGKTFAVGAPTERPDAYEVRVYDWPRGKLLHTFTGGHRAAVTALAYSPDGKALASGAADGSVLLWDLSAVPAPK
jgi:WD40 repeat protein